MRAWNVGHVKFHTSPFSILHGSRTESGVISLSLCDVHSLLTYWVANFQPFLLTSLSLSLSLSFSFSLSIYIYIYIYILGDNLLPLPRGKREPTSRKRDKKGRSSEEKEQRKKGIEAQRVKPFTPTLAIDELIGYEERTRNKRRENEERKRE